MSSGNDTEQPPKIVVTDVGLRARKDGKKRRSIRSRRSEVPEDLPPAMRVRFILGDYADHPGQHELRPIFSEMEEFNCETGCDGQWKETARWIKFEEDVEDGGNRWTKPFVGTLSLHALFELRSSFLHGSLILDTPATTVFGVVNALAEDMVVTQHITEQQKAKVVEILMRPHCHLYEIQRSSTLLTLNDRSRNSSVKNLNESRSKVGLNLLNVPTVSPSSSDLKKVGNAAFMKKIPHGAEVTNVLVGEVDFLDKPVSALVRLANSAILGDFTEVPLPSRFVFVLLGPKGQLDDYREVGRVVAWNGRNTWANHWNGRNNWGWNNWNNWGPVRSTSWGVGRWH